MKTVIHNGVQYEVEDWVKYICTDQDGKVYGFASKPVVGDSTGMWWPDTSTKFGDDLRCTLLYSGFDWKKLITEV